VPVVLDDVDEFVDDVVVVEFPLFVLLPVLAFLLHAAEKTIATNAIARIIIPGILLPVTTLFMLRLPYQGC
jgi:hypothetical protein